MEQIAKRSIIANAFIGKCTPYASKFLEVEHERAADCTVYRSTHGMYEVIRKECKVCLERRMCTCRKWDITGIPCEHGYAVLMEKTLPVHEYVVEWFHITTLRKTYEKSLIPLRGSVFWMREDTPLVVEPPVPKQPGRKKNSSKKVTKRKKGRNESPPKRPSGDESPPKRPTKELKQVMHCRVCGEEGHNARRHKKTTKVAESQI